MSSDRTALLIVRAWIEEGSSEPLRAQVRLSADVSAGFDRTLTLCRPEAVGTLVEEWLTELVASTEGSPVPSSANLPLPD